MHRISGVVLFLSIPFVLCAFDHSLRSEKSFELVKQSLQIPYYKVAVFLFLTALVYHALAGIRHLIADLGFFETFKAAKLTAVLMIVLTLITMTWIGMKLW